MNVPEIYLVEPYNAYTSKNKRKKHWSEIVEEQALLEKIIAEARNSTLPQNSPQNSAPSVAVNSSGQGVTGGGGHPVLSFFNPSVVVTFTPSPVTASAPNQIQFLNTSNPGLVAQGVATFSWNFGDGGTTVDPNPAHTFVTTGSFAVTVLATAAVNGTTGSATQSVLITAPTVAAAFSLSPTTGSFNSGAGLLVTFTNLTQTNNSQNPITYIWNFGSGSITSSAANPTFTYTATGSYTVRLSATGSFGITSTASALVLVTT